MYCKPFNTVIPCFRRIGQVRSMRDVVVWTSAQSQAGGVSKRNTACNISGRRKTLLTMAFRTRHTQRTIQGQSWASTDAHRPVAAGNLRNHTSPLHRFQRMQGHVTLANLRAFKQVPNKNIQTSSEVLNPASSSLPPLHKNTFSGSTSTFSILFPSM